MIKGQLDVELGILEKNADYIINEWNFCRLFKSTSIKGHTS